MMLSREQFESQLTKAIEGHAGCITAQDALLAHDAALRERVRELERERGACEVCWTVSWVPIERREEADGVNVSGTEHLARCEYCWMRRVFESKLATLTTAHQRAEEENNALLADRSIKWNGARMLAQFALSRLPKKHTTHNDGELFNVATGFMKSDVPHTTPWLLKMMEVARRDKNELPQQLYQAMEQINELKASLQQAVEALAGVRKERDAAIEAQNNALDIAAVINDPRVARLQAQLQAVEAALKLMTNRATW